MDPRSSLSDEQRVGAIDAFEQGLGDRATATLLGVPRWPVRRLYQHWQLRGREVLMSKSVRREYPQALKIAAVERFIAGEEAGEITRSLNIASRATLFGWVRRYREQGPVALVPKRRGRPPIPTTELERLKRENERLLAEVALLGKLQALRGEAPR